MMARDIHDRNKREGWVERRRRFQKMFGKEVREGTEKRAEATEVQPVEER